MAYIPLMQIAGVDLRDFIDIVVDDGIEAAKADYSKPTDELKLEGAIGGFEICRGVEDVIDLQAALVKARERTREHRLADPDSDLATTYWLVRCFELEVEWVCNCVAALCALDGIGTPLANLPTARGMSKAKEVRSRL